MSILASLEKSCYRHLSPLRAVLSALETERTKVTWLCMPLFLIADLPSKEPNETVRAVLGLLRQLVTPKSAESTPRARATTACAPALRRSLAVGTRVLASCSATQGGCAEPLLGACPGTRSTCRPCQQSPLFCSCVGGSVRTGPGLHLPTSQIMYLKTHMLLI